MSLLPLTVRILAVVIGSVCRNSLAQSSAYYQLDDELFSHYKPHIRPVLHSNTTTNVTMYVNVVAVNEVDEGTQVLIHTSVFDLRWRDEFLTWDPAQYGGVDKMELPADRVWLPPCFVQCLTVVNSVCEKRAVREDDFSLVVVHSTGDVRWLVQGVWQTTCRLDITYYPFDRQVCDFHLEMWTSPETEVKVTSTDIQMSLGFLSNSEWSLDGLDMSLTAHSLDVSTMEEFSSCTFRFHVRRFRLFHLLTFLSPNVVLALLVPLVFALPVETGEKMSFTMTLLLAFAVNLSVMMNSLPHSSLQHPLSLCTSGA
ncbi:neuronal acetylcholine receptor subunit alpha-6-like [Pomacea canaliculata]|uniref:neuronal acetylcholine receptor subunit alpha-6-like n=1 Tax=Pomacea canaliculata TaxID=400727 RepID=UPI000D725321|nr:neuronal acetylcholine receptor subunit alpha-6-like [Pomacea canaliculata]